MQAEGDSLSRAAWPSPLCVLVCCVDFAWELCISLELYLWGSFETEGKIVTTNSGILGIILSACSFSDYTPDMSLDCRPCENWLVAMKTRGKLHNHSAAVRSKETWSLLSSSVQQGLFLTHLYTEGLTFWHSNTMGGACISTVYHSWRTVQALRGKLKNSKVWQKLSGWKPALVFT